MNIRDKKVLLTILEDIKDIEDSVKQLQFNTLENFLENRLMQKSIVMSLINISEAVGELSDEVVKENNGIKWKQFKKLRNIAAHKYGAINFVLVWNIVNNNISAFKSGILMIVEK